MYVCMYVCTHTYTPNVMSLPFFPPDFANRSARLSRPLDGSRLACSAGWVRQSCVRHRIAHRNLAPGSVLFTEVPQIPTHICHTYCRKYHTFGHILPHSPMTILVALSQAVPCNVLLRAVGAKPVSRVRVGARTLFLHVRFPFRYPRFVGFDPILELVCER